MGINQVPPVVATPEVVSYATPGTYTFTPPAGTSVGNPAYARVVVTGAGGGGGAVRGGRSGAGGSAGQQIILPSVKITEPVSITVGAGGAGTSTSGATATAGGSSIFGSITAAGGAGAIATNAGAVTALMPASSQGANGVDGTRMVVYVGTGSNGTRFTADGVNWTTASNPNSYSTSPNLAWANNGRLHVHQFSGNSGQWYFHHSTNGTSWTQVTPSTNGLNANSVAISGDTMAVACDFPNAGSPTTTYMYTTNNGTSWANGTLPVNTPWGVVLTNGSTWVFAQQSSGANNVRSNTTLGGASSGWVARSAGSASNDWYGGAYGAGRFVLSSYGGLIYSSPDGATWTQRVSGGGNLRRMSFFGNKFFTRNESSTSTSYLYSTDGDNWVTGNLPAGSSSGGVWTFGFMLGTYYCITNTGRTHSSPDGINWTFLTTLDSTYVSSGPASGSFAASVISLGTVTANVPTAPAAYGSDLPPTGGGGGNSTSTTGSGGSGGAYVGVSAAAATGSAAATVGQVPGAGGGGGGTGSTAGAAGADGLVAIYL